MQSLFPTLILSLQASLPVIISLTHTMSKTPSKPNKENQDEFWDLGDDDLDLDEALEEAPAKEKKPKKEKETKTSPSSKEKPGKTEKKKVSKKEDTPSKKAPEPEAQPPEKPALEKTEPTRVRTKDGWTKEKKEKVPLSLIEKISLLAVVICLVGAAFWVISTFVNDAPQGELIAFNENFPAAGTNVTIENVTTWWRPPARTGDNPDNGVILSSNLIPCATLKISGSNSTTLRITFRDGKQELVGDTINLIVENGKFLRNDSDEITIHSTAGFANPSRINAYANGDIDPWALSIFEEDSENDAPIVKARISANTKLK